VNDKQLMELQVLNEQAKVLEAEVKKMAGAVVELTTAYATVEELEKGEAIFPVGGGVFVFGEVKDLNVLVPIGANYYVTMSKDKAKEEIKKRIEKIDEGVKQLEKEKEKLLARLYELSHKLRVKHDVEAHHTHD
jgi:prefoldin alpha subunit